MNQEERRKKIIDKWLENPSRPNHFIAKNLNVARSTVDSVIKRYLETLTVKRKQKSGGKNGAHDKSLDKKIVGVIVKNRAMSSRDVARKCNTNQTMVQRCKKRAGLKSRKKQKNYKSYRKAKKDNKNTSSKVVRLDWKQENVLGFGR